MRRLTIFLGLVGLAAWCCLLFGIGLDDLANRRTGPGIIFSVVVLPLCIGAIGIAAFRVIRPRLASRSDRAG